MADATGDDDEEVEVTPKLQPVEVVYCKVCSLPVEYCENGPSPDECRGAAGSVADAGTALAGLSLSGDAAAGAAAGAAAAAAVKGSKPADKKKPTALGTVLIAKVARSKKKAITTVSGLETFGCKLKDVAKSLGVCVCVCVCVCL
jgi:hypothetical protein